MAMENMFGMMADIMRVNGSMTKCKGKVRLNGLMARFMSEVTNMIKRVVMVSSHGQMVGYTKGIGNKINSMVKEF